MFNFFKKKQIQTEEIIVNDDKLPVVSITYNINQKLETSVDILMDDYGAESINAIYPNILKFSN